ncbi:MAG TPA: hypothetical protein PLU30_05665 [Verrucomicrobiae bacterium]|nr:hypothetical protein [Verrucomicrobiae bacterium]
MDLSINFRSLFKGVTDTLFGMALTQPESFHGAVRPIIEAQCGGDVVRGQAIALQGIREHLHVVKRHSDKFLVRFSEKVTYDGIRVPVAGRPTTPVGAGCGLDSNAEALEPFSYLYGFQMPGPVSVRPRSPGPTPFRDDQEHADLYLPPTFASVGLDIFKARLRAYRDGGGRAILLPGIVGMAESGGADAAHEEMRTLLEAFVPHADGFLWTPCCAGDGRVLEVGHVQRVAQLMRDIAGDKLNLLDMPAFEPPDRNRWLDLAGAFLSHGGGGLVVVRGLEVPKSRVPHSEDWPFTTAIQCGKSLAPYRHGAIEDARRAFPSAFIAACGGIHIADEAFDALGFANVIVENEAFTRFGPGLVPLFQNKIAMRVNFLHREELIDAPELTAYQRLRFASPDYCPPSPPDGTRR